MNLERLSSILELLKRSLGESYDNITTPIVLKNVCAPTLSANEVATAWKDFMDADAHRSTVWTNPRVRIFILVALVRRFEELRLQNYSGLRKALEEIKTLTGRPLTIMGTKCEVASRAAEALFLEARRHPGDELCFGMLEAANDLLNFILSECRQKDNTKYAKSLYGIRGVCRLMLAVQTKHMSAEAEYDLYKAAAEDLQTAFNLGNRGSSAAAYLLDALMHAFEIDQSDQTLARINEIIGRL
jgi:hypothetical protein